MWSFGVPNVPCGVERLSLCVIEIYASSQFLMYRVELKDCPKPAKIADCDMFLMYRVELKVSLDHIKTHCINLIGS